MGATREQASAFEQVRVAACVAEVEALIQITWEGRIRLDVRADSDLPFVQCDPLALQNAVLNLLFNARDAMPNGGVISIRAEAILLGPREGIELRVTESNAAAVRFYEGCGFVPTGERSPLRGGSDVMTETMSRDLEP